MRKEILQAPVAGIVNKLYVSSGSLVELDFLILDIEVMKLMYSVTSGISGKINLIVSQGEFVQEGQELGDITEV